jgi:hypothetical protein
VNTFKERLAKLRPDVKAITRIEKAIGATQDIFASEKQIEQDKQK